MVCQDEEAQKILFHFHGKCVVSELTHSKYYFPIKKYLPMMTRDELEKKIVAILVDEFEFEEPGLNDNLRDDHGFDSIDAIELLAKIEEMIGFQLSRKEKEQAMSIRTINDILDYVESMQANKENG